jgi:hypothetical protein
MASTSSGRLRGVYILDAQQKGAIGRGQIMRHQRRIGMAKVQQAVGAGGKAGARHDAARHPVDFLPTQALPARGDV